MSLWFSVFSLFPLWHWPAGHRNDTEILFVGVRKLIHWDACVVRFGKKKDSDADLAWRIGNLAIHTLSILNIFGN